MHIEPVDFNPPLTLSFDGKTHEYDDVYTFSFSGSVPFRAGQNARVVVPTLPHEESARSLSFASVPWSDEVLFSMHVGSDTLYKQAFSALTEGDTVQVVRVKGQTVIDGADTVCIAGGVGVTPFRSILLDAHQKEFDRNITLIHVSSDTYLFEEDLQHLPYEQHRLRRTDVIDAVQDVVARFLDARYLMAGSPSFLEGVSGYLKNAGVSDEQIVMSTFKGYDSFLD